jgi:FAD:protein FMN transferase
MRFLIILVFSVILLIACKNKDRELMHIEGSAQGTTYHISFIPSNSPIMKSEIDSVLYSLDMSLSTYKPESIISKINKNENDVLVDDYFEKVFNKSIEVSEKTNGYFDITVAPVINAWGFGFTKKSTVTKSLVDSLLQFVGYRQLSLENGQIKKTMPPVMLDFNAIAQGFSVDVLAGFLESKGVLNYMVELGGEVIARGKKKNGSYWKIGIDRPVDSLSNERILQATIDLADKAMATSGNYRKFYEEDGQRYAHIIDPHTGYPAKNNLLSVSVFAKDCMTADAYATAFMVMGLEKSLLFLKENKALGLEAFFVFDEKGVLKTQTSESLKKWIEEIN